VVKEASKRRTPVLHTITQRMAMSLWLVLVKHNALRSCKEHLVGVAWCSSAIKVEKSTNTSKVSWDVCHVEIAS
jgi:hypothetical protein